MNTPWGRSDHTETLAPDIVFVSTPSHGGLKVTGEALKKIPLAWRKASFNGQGMNGWFEEDCDWCMVALTFPDLFKPLEIEAAQQTFDHCIVKKLAA